MLFDLLARFIKKEIITPALLAMSKEYLTGKAPNLPFFKNTDLYDTVLYLKEVMVFNNFHNVSDLINYYSKKKEATSILIKNALDNLNKETIDQHMFCDEIKWEKLSNKESTSISENSIAFKIYQYYPTQHHQAPLIPMVNNWPTCIETNGCTKQIENQNIK